MKLSEWARRNGLSYRTAWRLFKDNQLPVPAKQLATGTILVFETTDDLEIKGVAVYGRVSSRDQKNDLDRQVARLCTYAATKNLSVCKVVTEIGSAMNGNRKKIIELLSDKGIHSILIEHRDRLTRFGFEYVEAALKSSGRSVIVLNENEIAADKNDLVRDMIEVLTSFCARLYGKRSAENRAKKAVKYLESENENNGQS